MPSRRRARPRQDCRCRSSRDATAARFQRLLEGVEVGRHRRLNPGGGQGSEEPYRTRGGLKVDHVDQLGPIADRRKQVADGRGEGPDISVDLQAGGWLEHGDLEAFLAPVGYGAKLPVGGPDPDRPGRGLPCLQDCVVQVGMFSKSARNAKTSSTGRWIVSVFWKVVMVASVISSRAAAGLRWDRGLAG